MLKGVPRTRMRCSFEAEKDDAARTGLLHYCHGIVCQEGCATAIDRLRCESAPVRAAQKVVDATLSATTIRVSHSSPGRLLGLCHAIRRIPLTLTCTPRGAFSGTVGDCAWWLRLRIVSIVQLWCASKSAIVLVHALVSSQGKASCAMQPQFDALTTALPADLLRPEGTRMPGLRSCTSYSLYGHSIWIRC